MKILYDIARQLLATDKDKMTKAELNVSNILVNAGVAKWEKVTRSLYPAVKVTEQLEIKLED